MHERFIVKNVVVGFEAMVEVGPERLTLGICEMRILDGGKGNGCGGGRIDGKGNGAEGRAGGIPW